ncbi:MAG: Glutamine--tRNA ligase [Halieaceae bacterium]|nr:MAG: Glutamine--tRNA ligase [Halieaceae bacterium]HCJ38527.1 glutamine--tRNA ligase [Halieaceae bacterium]|tara:strand:- start:262 stop:1914 length:1653 start_codon:yes stop_codon:yes gene_type:complete
MDTEHRSNFLRTQIQNDLNAGIVDRVVTRFPPEPNGYLHIGHAKSITVNFGLAEQFGGVCNLRFDDTNPEKESQRFIDAIKSDVSWLGYQWDGDVRYASSYFQQFYEWAVHLIESEKAYVCDLSADEAREYRGTLTTAGRDSPYRNRPIEENLRLFESMRAGEMEEGACVLRAKIDMASPNINLRDPTLYRIRKVAHHQTGDDWVIYPTYDFAHGQEDAIEGISHSICTLEFEDHKPLYDWFIENLPVPSRPRQFEFARLNVNFTVTSKRKLKLLVDSGVVSGWDDPRMPTIAGMRRRGYTPTALRHFCEEVGTSRSDGVVDVAMLESAVRNDLNRQAPRAMAVLNPLALELTNLDDAEILQIPNHPADEIMGKREVRLSPRIWIDREDFRQEANKKFKRLVLGKRVRLRGAYVIEAERCELDDQGEVIKVYASIVPQTLGGDPDDGVKAKGVIHWVDAETGVEAEIRSYDRLFTVEDPSRADNFDDVINPHSLLVTRGIVEMGLASVQPETRFQFEREGYFVADRYDHAAGAPVYNRVIGLRDTWTSHE